MTNQRRIGIALVVISVMMLLGAISFSVVSQRKAVSQKQGQSVGYNDTVKSNGAPVYLCGATTKTGSSCRKHVKNAGDRCWMHKGQ